MAVRTSSKLPTISSRRASLGVATFVLAALAASCGPEANPEPNVAIAPKPATTAAPPPIEEDRTPVEAAPQGLFLSVHATSPRAIAKAIKGYLPPSMPQLDPRMLVREATQDVGVDRIVDIDKPIDVAVTLPEGEASNGTPGSPRGAIAFGVEDDLDVAKALSGIAKVEVVKGGVLRLTTGAAPLPCVVAPALGEAKRRLVCTPFGDPMELAPWLARGVTRKPQPGSALHAELDAASLKKRYAPQLAQAHDQARALVGPEVKIGYAEIDKVLKHTAQTLVDEAFDLVDDLDALALDVTLPAEGPELSAAFGFGGKKSWIARAFLAGEGAPGAVPAKLGALPAEGAWLAGFSRATPDTDALVAPIQETLRELAVAAAANFKWPAKDKDLALDLVKYMFPAAADSSFVSGNAGKPEPAKTEVSGKLARSVVHALARKSFTISVVERDEKAPMALAKAFAAFVTRPALADMVRTLTKDRLSIKVTSKALPTKGLPKGSWAQRYELAVNAIERQEEPPKGKIKLTKVKSTPLGKLVAESMIAPDGPRTWVGFGQNLAEGDLVQRLVAAIAGNAPQPLSSKDGFGFATEGAPTSGGLLLLEGLLHAFDRTGKSEEMLAALPDQGRSAIAWRFLPGKPAKSSAQISVHVPRDLVAAGTWFIARF